MSDDHGPNRLCEILLELLAFPCEGMLGEMPCWIESVWPAAIEAKATVTDLFGTHERSLSELHFRSSAANEAVAAERARVLALMQVQPFESMEEAVANPERFGIFLEARVSELVADVVPGDPQDWDRLDALILGIELALLLSEEEVAIEASEELLGWIARMPQPYAAAAIQRAAELVALLLATYHLHAPVTEELIEAVVPVELLHRVFFPSSATVSKAFDGDEDLRRAWFGVRSGQIGTLEVAMIAVDKTTLVEASRLFADLNQAEQRAVIGTLLAHERGSAAKRLLDLTRSRLTPASSEDLEARIEAWEAARWRPGYEHWRERGTVEALAQWVAEEGNTVIEDPSFPELRHVARSPRVLQELRDRDLLSLIVIRSGEIGLSEVSSWMLQELAPELANDGHAYAAILVYAGLARRHLARKKRRYYGLAQDAAFNAFSLASTTGLTETCQALFEAIRGDFPNTQFAKRVAAWTNPRPT